ncbi:MAG: potassium channel family protein [Clostridium perfringens]|nr:potassium channel family protein [Clostridium perfringens]
MGVLAIIVAILIISEMLISIPNNILKVFETIDIIIWIIFCIDYFVRLLISKNKIIFIKKNIIDLLSIIPFNSMFKILRITRFAKLIKFTRLVDIFKGTRVLVLISKFQYRTKEFLRINNFNYAIYFVATVILLGAIGISIVEEISFSNALWWSFVTATTVGYGDVIPQTLGGRLIAVFLMIIGIGFVGLLTATIATFFLTNSKKQRNTYKNDVIDDIKSKLDDFDSITKEELREMFKVLEVLKD